MKLSYQLSLLINEILKQKGYNRDFSNLDEKFSVFSLDELNMITEIKLSGIHDVSGIENLKKLKKLIITSIDFAFVNTGESIKNNEYINKIYDFSFLNKIESLEELQIENDINVKSIDFTNLRKLQKLVLIHNPNLEELKGLDQLKNLTKVLIYGNNIKSDIDIEKYIENTIATNPNVLDISMYMSAVKGDRKLAKLISDADLLGQTQLKFGEYIGFLDLSILKPQNLYDMYTKLDIFFKKNNLYEESELSKIKFVYDYVVRNVKFAKDELEKRNNYFIEIKKQNQKVPDYLVKNFISLHNSYIAFHFKKANCEGIVNLMSFMLQMLGIKSSNVHCLDKRYKNHYDPNHSIIRLEYNNQWLYCDPTYDLNNPYENFMKSITDLEETHLFNDFEVMINEERKNAEYNGTDINWKAK